MTCFVCGEDSTNYKLERYSPLGFEADENLCRECVYSAIPKLKELEDGERERDYKRRKQEMIDKGLIR